MGIREKDGVSCDGERWRQKDTSEGEGEEAMKRKKLKRETMLRDSGMLYDPNEMRVRLEEGKERSLICYERDDRRGRTRD